MSASPLTYLNDLGTLPKMVTEAGKLVGVIETSGAGNNPTIMGWAAELGLARVYTADAVPWCGLFMALVAKRAGKVPPINPLWALNWSNWGAPAGQPCLGDVLVFVRNGGGHVALYAGEDRQGYYHTLGGNQGDKVCITRIPKARLHAARIPPFQIQMPESREPIILNAAGKISEGEA